MKTYFPAILSPDDVDGGYIAVVVGNPGNG